MEWSCLYLSCMIFFASLIWVGFLCLIKFIGLSDCVWGPLYHLVKRAFIEGLNVCIISLHWLFNDFTWTDWIDPCIYGLMERT